MRIESAGKNFLKKVFLSPLSKTYLLRRNFFWKKGESFFQKMFSRETCWFMDKPLL
jgi:hypothetical protein